MSKKTTGGLKAGSYYNTYRKGFTRLQIVSTLAIISFITSCFLYNSNSGSNIIFVKAKHYNDHVYTGLTKNMTKYQKPKKPLPYSETVPLMDVPAFNMEPVSPLEIIPEYDLMVDNYKSKSWSTSKTKFIQKFNELDPALKCKFYFRNLYSIDEEWENGLELVTLDINVKDEDFDKKIEDKYKIKLENSNTRRYYKRRHDIGFLFQRMRIYEKCLMHRKAASIITTPKSNRVDDLLNKNARAKREEESFDKEVEEEKDNEIKLTVADIFATDSPVEEEQLNLLQKTYDVLWGKHTKDYQGVYSPNNYKNSDQYDFEHRMFPFVAKYKANTFKDVVPRIRRNDRLLPQGHLPDLSTKDESFAFKYNPDLTLWDNWQRMSAQVANRGIVLSFGEKHLEWALKLIATLRYQNNTLPVAIMMKGGELKDNTIEKLVHTARSRNFETDSSDKNATFPKQEILFVDVTNTLAPDYRNKYKAFMSKWPASIFNPFENFIFLDIDAISYVDFNYYFETEQFLDSGSYFFRDRTLKFKLRDDKCVGMFEALQPKFYEAKYFENYPIMNNEYLMEQCEKNLDTIEEIIYKRFFKDKLNFQMESGLLAIDKNKHVIPLVLGSMMHRGERVGSCGYGDKEYFWLGFLMAGHKFRFDVNPPAAIGAYQKEGDARGKICSVQLAHVSDDEHLLWLNGGGNFCKATGEAKKDWSTDNTLVHEWAKSEEELIKFYEKTPIECDYAVISDDFEYSWGQRSHHCNGYEWCAHYSRELHEYSFTKKENRGYLVKFDKAERDHIWYSNEVWAKFDTTKVGTISLKED